MNTLKIVCVLVLGLLLHRVSSADGREQTLRIEVAPSPTGQNASGLLRDTIQQTIDRMRHDGFQQGEIVLAPGEYRLEKTHDDPDKLIPIFGASHLTIRGAGATTRLVVYDTDLNSRDALRKIFWIGDCQQLTLENFSIDFAPAAREWIQGFARQVEKAEGAEATFTLALDAASPPFRKEYFKPGRTLGIALNEHLQPREDFPDYFEIVDIQPENDVLKVRARIPGGETLDSKAFLQDQRVVLARRNPGENLFYFGGANVHPVLRNIHIAASRGLCIEANGCDRLELDDVRLERASGQWLVSPGDGLHYANGQRGPLVQNCRFEGLGDDAINIYAKPFALTVPQPGIYAVGDAISSLHEGDELWVYDNRKPGEGRVVSVEKIEDKQFIGQAIEGTLAPSRAVNLSRSGSDFIIRKNRFGSLRGLGCRLQTGKGIVDGNTFFRTSGAPVSLECGLANAYDEGPFPYAIEIKNNRFESCATSGYGRIAIRRVAPWDPQNEHSIVFRDIRHSGNTVVSMREADF